MSISSWPTTVPPGWRKSGNPEPGDELPERLRDRVEVAAAVARRQRQAREPELRHGTLGLLDVAVPRHGVTVPSAASRPDARARAPRRSRCTRGSGRASRVEVAVPDVRVGDDRRRDARLLLALEQPVDVEHVVRHPAVRRPGSREEVTVRVDDRGHVPMPPTPSVFGSRNSSNPATPHSRPMPL